MKTCKPYKDQHVGQPSLNPYPALTVDWGRLLFAFLNAGNLFKDTGQAAAMIHGISYFSQINWI